MVEPSMPWIPSWFEAIEPFHIVGPIHYVGTKGLGVYLITTPAGHILLNGTMPRSAPLVRDAIRKLGFRVEDIHLLLFSHAHIDHVGTLAYFKALTGARVEALAEEVELLTTGGRTDYLYGKLSLLHFKPVIPDHVFHDGDTITFGGLSLTAHYTPGHTRGAVTWETTVEDNGRTYHVVFPDGGGINPGTHLVKKASYPGIADDYRRTFRFQETLHPDIFLAYHAEFFGLEAKRERMETEGVQAWVDPDGYQHQVADNRAKFERLVAEESGR